MPKKKYSTPNTGNFHSIGESMRVPSIPIDIVYMASSEDRKLLNLQNLKSISQRSHETTERFGTKDQSARSSKERGPRQSLLRKKSPSQKLIVTRREKKETFCLPANFDH